MPTKPKTRNTSPRKAATARANGAKSTGPKSPAGKARAAMNSLKHGVYSESLILPNEDPADLAALRTYYFNRFQPVDPVEVDLVEVMIVCMWRLRRLSRTDTGILLREFQSAGKTVRGFEQMTPENQASLVALRHLNLNGNAISALDRQESKLYRHFSRAMNDLVKLRKNFPIGGDGPEPESALRNEPTASGADSPQPAGLTSHPGVGYPENPLAEARNPRSLKRLSGAKIIPFRSGFRRGLGAPRAA